MILSWNKTITTIYYLRTIIREKIKWLDRCKYQSINISSLTMNLKSCSMMHEALEVVFLHPSNFCRFDDLRVFKSNKCSITKTSTRNDIFTIFNKLNVCICKKCRNWKTEKKRKNIEKHMLLFLISSCHFRIQFQISLWTNNRHYQTIIF